jgi:uncharacterized membrane protein YtjA (UPF0391 family)
MWKDTTGRKALPPPIARKRGLLPWSAIPLLISVVAAGLGFRDGPPSDVGLARWVAFFFAMVFLVLLVAAIFQRRRSF